MNTIVSFELAKLLKEKGFDDICYKWYSVQGGLYCQDEFDNCRGFIPAYECEAPTIAEVVMWLYDNHGIWIIVSYEDTAPSKEWYWSALKHGEDRAYQYYKFNSPTNAYEAAIKYALNNLV